MQNLRPTSADRNPLAAIIDPLTRLAAVESALALASTFAAAGAVKDAQAALALAWPALHLASREASDAPRLATLARALREAEEALCEMNPDAAPGWRHAA